MTVEITNLAQVFDLRPQTVKGEFVTLLPASAKAVQEADQRLISAYVTLGLTDADREGNSRLAAVQVLSLRRRYTVAVGDLGNSPWKLSLLENGVKDVPDVAGSGQPYKQHLKTVNAEIDRQLQQALEELGHSKTRAGDLVAEGRKRSEARIRHHVRVLLEDQLTAEQLVSYGYGPYGPFKANQKVTDESLRAMGRADLATDTGDTSAAQDAAKPANLVEVGHGAYQTAIEQDGIDGAVNLLLGIMERMATYTGAPPKNASQRYQAIVRQVRMVAGTWNLNTDGTVKTDAPAPAPAAKAPRASKAAAK